MIKLNAILLYFADKKSEDHFRDIGKGTFYDYITTIYCSSNSVCNIFAAVLTLLGYWQLRAGELFIVPANILRP